MATTYKAQAIAHELADRLKARALLGGATIVEKFDTDQNPYIQLGALTTDTATAIIKVEPFAWPLAQDVLGLTANQFTPHVVKVIWETGSTGMTDAYKVSLVQQATDMGCYTQLYGSSHGGGVVLADIDDSTKLLESYAPDFFRPLINGQ